MNGEVTFASSSFGDVIKRARLVKGLTQKELAKCCDNISAEYISQIEKKQKLPSQKICTRLAETLDLDRVALLLLAYRCKAPPEIQALLLPQCPSEAEDSLLVLFSQLYLSLRLLPAERQAKIIRILALLIAEEGSSVDTLRSSLC